MNKEKVIEEIKDMYYHFYSDADRRTQNLFNDIISIIEKSSNDKFNNGNISTWDIARLANDKKHKFWFKEINNCMLTTIGYIINSTPERLYILGDDGFAIIPYDRLLMCVPVKE